MNAYKELIHELDALNDEQIPQVVALLRSLAHKPDMQNTPAAQPRKAGTLKGKIWMADDFDEPLEDFREYMQ